MNEISAKPVIEFRQPSPFWQTVGRTLARLTGWTIKNDLPDDPKMVLIFFPHTSNIDVLHAIPAAFAIGLKPSWLVKDDIYVGPFKPMLDKLGAIPINRHARENKVEQIVDAIKNTDRVMFTLSPEGTRSKTEYWRTGFYHIARLAQVPIHFAYIDYPTKTVGGAPGFIPSGDMDADMARIRAFYTDKRGRFPEKVGPVRFKNQ
ncbi:MAG: lysophospholipid acyltransferase family protein [Anaerolineales bacterium]|nr:lysophospholipid acyltransferase family protein [Anaerolineales bacterium]